MRWLLILLLTLNGCYLLWESLRDAPEQEVYPELPSAPRVELLDEGRASPARPPDTGDGGESSSAMVAGRCARVGPFADAQARSAFLDALDPGLELSPQSSERVVETLYRTFLPPYPDREAAMEANEELGRVLQEQDLSIDSFVIDSGELSNGISLGLFGQQDNAQAVQRRMRELDYPVRIREEPRSETEFWLLARGGEAVMELARQWPELSVEDESLRMAENLCETIAPRPDFP